MARRPVARHRRALDWLRAAADGTLAGRGAPFEVPHFPGAAASETTVVYSERASSFGQWQGSQEQCGVLELRRWRPDRQCCSSPAS